MKRGGYEAIVFDLFGTLVKGLDLEAYHRSLERMAAALGAPAEEFARLWNEETANRRLIGALKSPEENIEYIRKALGLPPELDRIVEAVRIRLAYYRASLVPRAEAVWTLKMLRETGHRLGLISDCSYEAPLLWPETALAGLIDEPVFSCVEGCAKPDPRLYEIACRRLAVSPQRCLYVGDGDGHELAGAVRRGMDAVMIRIPSEEAAGVYRRNPEEWDGPRIASLSEVLTMVGVGIG